MLTLSATGDYKKTIEYLKNTASKSIVPIKQTLKQYGEDGVKALSNNTPVDTGDTASSWYYEIEDDGKTATIYWCNSHVNEGVNIAVILQYGHGTGSGAYVEGVDYINPSLAPIFDKIADEAFRRITS